MKTYFKKLKTKIKIFRCLKEKRKIFEQNKSIALNILFLLKDNEEITLLYKSEYNLKQKNKVFLLMINDDEKYYFAVKSKLQLFI